MKRILVIDDEEILTRTFTRLLEKAGYEVYSVCHGHDAIAIAQEEDFNLIVSDIRMPGMNGVEVIKAIRKTGTEKSKTAPLIFVTGYADEPILSEVQEIKPIACVHKPFDCIELLKKVTTAIGE